MSSHHRSHLAMVATTQLLCCLLVITSCSSEQTARDIFYADADMDVADLQPDSAIDLLEDAHCTHASCDDGLFCNGREYCGPDGRCASASPLVCDDGVDCTTDLCDESLRACRTIVEPHACAGTAICDPVVGCRSLPPCVTADACDDGVACTDDACIDGRCQYVAFDVRCEEGDFCTTPERCAPFLGCLAGVERNCDDGEPCTSDVCDAAAGHCVYALRDEDHDGHAALECGGDDCDDARAAVNPSATVDLCDGVDDDCDALLDEDAPFATPTFVSLAESRAADTVWAVGDGDARYLLRLEEAAGAFSLTIERIDPVGASVWSSALGPWSSAPAFTQFVATAGGPVVLTALPSAGEHTIVATAVHADGSLTSTDIKGAVAGLAALAAGPGVDLHLLAVAWVEGDALAPQLRASVVDPNGVAAPLLDDVDLSPQTLSPTGPLSVQALPSGAGVTVAWFDETTASLTVSQNALGVLTHVALTNTSGAHHPVLDLSPTGGSQLFWAAPDGAAQALWMLPFDDLTGTATVFASGPSPSVVFASIDAVRRVAAGPLSGLVFLASWAGQTHAYYASTTRSGDPALIAQAAAGVDVAFDGTLLWALVVDDTEALQWVASACR